MKRLAVLGLLVLVGVVAPARADTKTVTAVGLRFIDADDGLEPIEIAQGDSLEFLNADPLSLTDGHNLTHYAPVPLFQSDRILIGQSADVVGVQALLPGDYPFVCTIHEGMAGTLEVVPAMPGY
jgi:plastocyanin